jgi:TPR repeat protein
VSTDVRDQSLYQQALDLATSPGADLEAVRPLLISAHEAGDARATYALATWYLHGRVVRKNMRKAVALLRQAARDNLPDALYDLAVCYENGEGVRKSMRRAASLYLKAALSGDLPSVYEVGRCYYHGLGVTADKAMANVWLDRAHDLGAGSGS